LLESEVYGRELKREDKKNEGRPLRWDDRPFGTGTIAALGRWTQRLKEERPGKDTIKYEIIFYYFQRKAEYDKEYAKGDGNDEKDALGGNSDYGAERRGAGPGGQARRAGLGRGAGG
jgi:hypothetical protein